MDISTVIEVMDSLVRPSLVARKIDLEAMLRTNIESMKMKFHSFVKLDLDDQTSDARWLFIKYCLYLLDYLCQCMEDCIEREKSDPRFSSAATNLAPPLSSAALSIGQQEIVAALLQFLSLLGICPNLSDGVGIPLQLRTNYKYLLVPQEKFSLLKRKERLMSCVEVLLRCTKLPDLDTLVLTCHLNDILSSLCQICYENDRSVVCGPCTCGESSGSSICNSRNCCKKNKLEKQMLEFMDHVKPVVVIKELMVLQGGSGRMKQTIRGLEKPALASSPPWLRLVCGRLLSQRLVRENGIRHVAAAMLEGTSDEAAESKKMETLAGIIATCPRFMTAEEYVLNICGQLQTILRHEEAMTWKNRIVTDSVRSLHVKHPQLTRKYFMDDVLRPLRLMLKPDNVTVKIVVNEEDLMRCLETVHKLFASRPDPDEEFLKLLIPFCHPLFSVYARARKGVPYIRELLKKMMVMVVRNVSVDWSLILLLALACEERLNLACLTVETMSPLVCIAIGSGGGYCVLNDSLDEPEVDRAEALIDLVLELKTDGVAGRFFIHLVQELTEIVADRHDDGCDDDVRLLTLEERHERTLKRRLIVMKLLGELSDKLGHTTIQEPEQIIAFVKATLERGIYVLQRSEDDLLGVFENETMSMAMSLLTALMGGTAKLSNDDRVAMETLLPLLNDIATNHPDTSISEMATDIRIAIATRGAVLGLTRDDKASSSGARKKIVQLDTRKKHQKKVGEYQKKPLIEVISETDDENKLQKDSKITENLAPFEQAMKELCDPLIPVRGHALIALRKLIQSNDQETLKNMSVLKRIFVENLDHKDSYIYLSAIEGLAQLGDKIPDEMVPLICEEITKGQESRSIDLRLKLGEALMKITRGLGDVLPKYGPRVLNVLLASCRNEEASVRASALSNLGQACRLLRWSLGMDVHEICACCTALLKTDDEVEVRRAAGAMIHQLLQGMDTTNLQVLDTALRDLYRQLKQSCQSETDEALLAHARAALTSLDDVMKTALFPKQDLKKEIRISHPF